MILTEDLLATIKMFNQPGEKIDFDFVRFYLLGSDKKKDAENRITAYVNNSNFMECPLYKKYKKRDFKNYISYMDNLIEDGSIGKIFDEDDVSYYLLNNNFAQRLFFKKLMIKYEVNNFAEFNLEDFSDKLVDKSKLNNNRLKPVHFDFKKGRKLLEIETKLDLDFLRELQSVDFLNDAITQPLSLKYGLSDEKEFIPKFMFEPYDGSTLFVDVMSFEDFIVTDNITRYNALKRFCLNNNFNYEFVSKVDDVWVSMSDLLERNYSKELEKTILHNIKTNGYIGQKEVEEIFESKSFDKRDLMPIVYYNDLKIDDSYPYIIKL